MLVRLAGGLLLAITVALAPPAAGAKSDVPDATSVLPSPTGPSAVGTTAPT